MEEKQKPPKRFGEFARDHVPLDGSKLKIADVLNKEILVTGFRANASKFNNHICLTIQCLIGDQHYVIFTGSQVLLDQCKAYEVEIPFLATIKRIDKYLSFT